MKLMGYKGLNGASAKVVSALAKYGLLEGHGESLRVSNLGQDLILHQPGDPEYDLALRTAGLRPAFFQELRNLYPHGLPSDHSLRATLIKRGFNPGVIEGAVRAFRETMDLLGNLPIESDVEAEGLRKPDNTSVSRRSPSGAGSVSDQHDSVTLRSITLPISGSAWAELNGPFPITESGWLQMMQVLAAMKPALVSSDTDLTSQTLKPPDDSNGEVSGDGVH